MPSKGPPRVSNLVVEVGWTTLTFQYWTPPLELLPDRVCRHAVWGKMSRARADRVTSDDGIAEFCWDKSLPTLMRAKISPVVAGQRRSFRQVRGLGDIRRNFLTLLPTDVLIQAPPYFSSAQQDRLVMAVARTVEKLSKLCSEASWRGVVEIGRIVDVSSQRINRSVDGHPTEPTRLVSPQIPQRRANDVNMGTKLMSIHDREVCTHLINR